MDLGPNLREKLELLRNEEFLENKEEIIPKLSDLLVQAMKKRKTNGKIAIAFSGGVDSTLIAFLCEKLGQDFTLYAVGLEGSKDMLAAEEVAQEMQWDVKKIIITEEEVEELIKEVIKITNKRDPITIGVGIVTLSVVKNCKEDILFTGLGSEEIFAGYERHKENTFEACWEGLLNIWERDIQRDLSIAKTYNKEIILPFLDKKLIQYGMRIHPSLKIQEFKKQILREATVHLGLKEKFAFRKKCAAQYGSKVDKVLEKLAKKKGLRKKEYLEKL